MTAWQVGILFIVFIALVGAAAAQLLSRKPAPTPQQPSAAAVAQPMPDLKPREAKTWRLKMNGVVCSILRAETRPPRAVLTGRTPAHWSIQRGDYVLLEWPGGTTTRYRVVGITRPGGDLYFIDAMFAPRVVAGRLA